jgi:hypothetical protein
MGKWRSYRVASKQAEQAFQPEQALFFLRKAELIRQFAPLAGIIIL